MILQRFPKFLAGNLLGTLVDTLVLWVFSHFVFQSYVGKVIISPVISFECAVFVNFLIAYYFTWKDRVSQLTTGSFFRHYVAYNASCTGAFLVKMGLLMLIQWLTKLDVVICNLLALCVSGGINFAMNEFVIFKKKKEAEAWPLITMEEVETLSPVFKGRFGNALANSLMHITGIDQLAERYGRHEDLAGLEFVSAFLKDLDLSYEVQGMEHLQAVLEGPFITISNHPYGGLDGLVLIDLFGHLREDYKVMANKFLSLVKTIKGNFISVIPKTDSSNGIAQESISGVKKAIEHIKAGHPLGIFPAGAVSDFSFKDFSVRDREWQASAVRFIQKMKVPIVPVRFIDKNSSFFYFLGLVNWKVRTLRLPREVLNKEGKTIRLGIGPVISVEEQGQYTQSDAFGSMLRDAVYNIEYQSE